MEDNKSIIMQTFSLSEEENNGFINNNRSILISSNMARELNIEKDDKINLRYETKFEKADASDYLIIKGIFESDNELESNMVFANEEVINQNYFLNLPKENAAFNSETELAPLLVKEWELLERSGNSDENRIKHQLLNRTDWTGAVLDVQSMYEFAMAEGVLQLEQSPKMISLVAVFVLFFIILIGVVNTLRMSIRERTREIGTNRAIGMLRGDVQSVFIMEIFYLTVFACIAGLILAFILMGTLGSIVFDMGDNPFSMLLINNQIYFLPTISAVLGSFTFILIVSLFIAVFPSGRAAKMKIADALRHYE